MEPRSWTYEDSHWYNTAITPTVAAVTQHYPSQTEYQAAYMAPTQNCVSMVGEGQRLAALYQSRDRRWSVTEQLDAMAEKQRELLSRARDHLSHVGDDCEKSEPTLAHYSTKPFDGGRSYHHDDEVENTIEVYVPRGAGLPSHSTCIYEKRHYDRGVQDNIFNDTTYARHDVDSEERYLQPKTRALAERTLKKAKNRVIRSVV